jgi:hypothetical protein
MTYTNDIEVEVDFSDVDPNLLNTSNNEESSTIVTKSETISLDTNSSIPNDTDLNVNDEDELQPVVAGSTSRFFKKK